MADEKKLDPQAVKERLGKHLRSADELTRAGRFDDAITEIQSALEIDPKNNFARSFLERVKLMNKRSQQKETEQVVSEEVSFEERMTLISQYLSAAEAYINKKDYKHALEEVARVYKIDSKNYYAQTYSQRIETLMLEQEAEDATKRRAEEFAKRQADEAAKRAAEEISRKEAEELQKKAAAEAEKKSLIEISNKEREDAAPAQDKTPPVKTEVKEAAGLNERGSTIMYRELLKDFWFDGKLSEEENLELTTMRTLFGITPEEHDRLEREIKIESYVDALRIAWRDNILSDTEEKTLQIMRDKYGISKDDQATAEARFEEIKKSAKSRTIILVVDPDRENLVALNKLLKQHGFIIFMAQKVEDALQILNTQTPNCIISEVLFPKGQMDGTELLKKIREHATLKHVAFFFISSINDKKVIRASYRLGTDHFLTKPIDNDILLATIDGKLHSQS